MLVFDPQHHFEVHSYTAIHWNGIVWKIMDEDFKEYWWENWGHTNTNKSVAYWNTLMYHKGNPPDLHEGLIINFHDPKDLILFKLSI